MPFLLSYEWLRFSPPTEKPPTPREGIERHFIDTPLGALEILYAQTKLSTAADVVRSTPIFFVHGGMGSAWVWEEYMQYLSARGVPCYAISLRGHGHSWHPSYLRMVFGTPRSALEDDVVAGVKWAQSQEGGAEVLLVGHSSGGGLSQAILSQGKLTVRALALAGAVPGFGSMGVYVNWWLLDPWFTIRMYFHGMHPNSPLSHPALTRAVFFSDKYPQDRLINFQRHTNAYESYLWPFSMMFRFSDPRSIIRHISGWDTPGQRLLVLTGTNDKIMTIPIMKRLAAWYREAYGWLVSQKKIEMSGETNEAVAEVKGEDGLYSAGAGVRFCVVPGAGHHFQNDVGWEVGARQLLDFWKQL